jgi:hypothetical protein
MTIEGAGKNAMKVSANWFPTATLSLGGPPVPVTAEGTISGMTVQARQLGGGAIEISRLRDGIPFSRSVFRVSADGRSLTNTVTQFGPAGPVGEPAVYVYYKQ